LIKNGEDSVLFFFSIYIPIYPSIVVFDRGLGQSQVGSSGFWLFCSQQQQRNHRLHRVCKSDLRSENNRPGFISLNKSVTNYVT
jgi:hypothetical protein